MMAGSNLAMQFGWLPLISDIGKMIDFQNIVDKRVAELKRLYSKGGLKRTFRNFETNEVNTGQSTLQSSNFICQADYIIVREVKVWTTLRWKPNSATINGLPVTDKALQQEARRSTFDLGHKLRQNIDAASVWEAIPFSWFADYFSNVGDVLKAGRNQLPVTASGGCVMRQLRSTCDFSNIVCSHQLQGSGGHHERVTKRRFLYPTPSPSFSAHLPFLNGGQLSILGSLAVVLLMGGKPNTQL
jgi:hypothetical protein